MPRALWLEEGNSKAKFFHRVAVSNKREFHRVGGGK